MSAVPDPGAALRHVHDGLDGLVTQALDHLPGSIRVFVPSWAIYLVVLVAAVYAIERFGRFLWGLGHDERDPIRLYTPAQRRAATLRAGGRCEHKVWYWRRCTVRVGLQGDHVFPWSKGGATIESNLQMLCGPHNRRKSSKVPSWVSIRMLERRRRSYFPDDADPRVVWRIKH